MRVPPAPDQRSTFSEEPDAELFRRWQSHGDRRAREALVLRHLSLARKLAKRYARTQEPFDDLNQVASLGLVKAIDRFDPARGVTFSSFAVPTILGELKRHFRDKGWAVHLPRGLQELVLKVQAAEAKLSARDGSAPTVIEIAEYLELETEAVLEALEAGAAHHATSLDAPIELGIDDGADTRHDTIGSEDDRYALVDMSATLEAAVGRLQKSDRHVFLLRFRHQMTQREIAERLGVSQMQISRILRRITDQLHDTMDVAHASGQPRRRRARRRTGD